MSQKNALIVEDTEANRIFFERLLTQAGFAVHGLACGRDAMEKLKTMPQLSLAVFDMQVPNFNGLDLTVQTRALFPDACIVVATMHDERTLMESAFQKGCNIFLVKPHGLIELYNRVTKRGLEQIKRDGHLVIDQYGPRKFDLAYR